MTASPCSKSRRPLTGLVLHADNSFETLLASDHERSLDRCAGTNSRGRLGPFQVLHRTAADAESAGPGAGYPPDVRAMVVACSSRKRCDNRDRAESAPCASSSSKSRL